MLSFVNDYSEGAHLAAAHKPCRGGDQPPAGERRSPLREREQKKNRRWRFFFYTVQNQPIFAELTLMPGPIVEAMVQLLIY